MNRTVIIILVTISTVAMFSCGGLDPEAVKPFSGFRGTIRYSGGAQVWPTDTIYDLRMVAFERKPEVVEEIIAMIAIQTAGFTASLPLRVDSTVYELSVQATPRTFTYIVVAMQNGPDPFRDWLMLDIHSETKDPLRPSHVVVPNNGVVNIDFMVDFANIPPQPFK